MNTRRFLFITVLSMAVLAGCKARPSLVPNSDPMLRKTNAEFAADAKKRHPYPADATKGPEAVARAQVGYDRNKIELANLSNEDWKDVDVWVNGAYVVHLPRVEKGKLKTINFPMLYKELSDMSEDVYRAFGPRYSSQRKCVDAYACYNPFEMDANLDKGGYYQ